MELQEKIKKDIEEILQKNKARLLNIENMSPKGESYVVTYIPISQDCDKNKLKREILNYFSNSWK